MPLNWPPTTVEPEDSFNRNIPEGLSFSCRVTILARLAGELFMNGIIYIIGLVVVVLAILSFLGLR
ncbi:hypothetical protein ASE66_24610 [Bosea sp. Root483D1]|uniref:hypothetical protein n=1 Tax=Bosea sp. Root483D1 TaxID=1736544 RepID=UPI000709AC53|nr:hypothetical protein [Bosea sp. Root483D1]KRE11698.1 hypothetical protein ASE66_24610 [Bosea sp. Root483D1]